MNGNKNASGGKTEMREGKTEMREGKWEGREGKWEGREGKWLTGCVPGLGWTVEGVGVWGVTEHGQERPSPKRLA